MGIRHFTTFTTECSGNDLTRKNGENKRRKDIGIQDFRLNQGHVTIRSQVVTLAIQTVADIPRHDVVSPSS